MSRSISLHEFTDGFFPVLARNLPQNHYLIKGGQAISFHMTNVESPENVRYSKDIDLSFKSSNFELDKNKFLETIVQEYNRTETTKFFILEKTIQLERLPKDKNLYFGWKLSFAVSRKDGSPGKVFFKECNSVFIRIDFTFGEVVSDKWVVVCKDINYAGIPLIVAEKYRAICSQIEGAVPGVIITPRPKDFYDISILFNTVYKKSPSKKELVFINDAMSECFSIKEMSLKLLERLDDNEIKLFHASNYDDQVTLTLPANSKNKDITFDQVYSDTLELLDLLKS